MRNLKRALSLALASMMLLGMMVIGAGAASVNDMDKVVNKEAVALMVDLGIIEGDNTGAFNPTGTINRAGVTKLAYYIQMGNADPSVYTGANYFTDVEGHWAEGYINYCYAQGLLDGRGDGTFNPGGSLTVVGLAKVLLNSIGYESESRGYVGTGWTINATRDAQTSNLLVGVTQGMNDVVTRDTAALMFYNALFTATKVPEYQYDMGQQYVTKYNDGPSLASTNYNGLTKVTATLAVDSGKVGSSTTITSGLMTGNPASLVATLPTGLTNLAASSLDDGKTITFYVDKNNKLISSSITVVASSNVVVPYGLTAGAVTVSGSALKWLKDNGITADTQLKDITVNYYTEAGKVAAVAPFENSKGNGSANSTVTLGAALAQIVPGTIVTLVDNEKDGTVDSINVVEKALDDVTAGGVTTRTNPTTGVLEVKVEGVVDRWTTAALVSGYNGLVAGDKVLVYKVDGVTYIEKCASFVGQATSSTVATITINGKAYMASGLNSSFDTISKIANAGYNKDVTYYLDSEGFIVAAVPVDGETVTLNFGIVLDYKKIEGTGWNNDIYQALLLYLDGTTEIVTVSKVSATLDGELTAAADGSIDPATPTFVTYTKNADSTYNLKKVSSATVDGVAYALAGAGTDITSGTPKFDGTLVGNNGTIFIGAATEDGKTVYTVYTGIANVPSGTASSVSNNVLTADGIAKIVYMGNFAVDADEGKANLVYITSPLYTYYPAIANVSDAYYEYKAIVNGEVTTVKADSAIFSAAGMYNVTTTTTATKDNYITAVEAVSTYVQGISCADGVVTVGSDYYTYTADTKVYVIDNGSVSEIAPNAITEDADDLVLVVTAGNNGTAKTTIKYLYIVKGEFAELPTVSASGGSANMDGSTIADAATGNTVTVTPASGVTVTVSGAGTEATAAAGSPATYTLAEGDMGSIITVTVSATDKDTYTLVYNVVAAE